MRNQELCAARNEKIAETFYYMYEVRRIRMDDAIDVLATKLFFLEPKYVEKLLLYNASTKIYLSNLDKMSKSDIEKRVAVFNFNLIFSELKRLHSD